MNATIEKKTKTADRCCRGARHRYRRGRDVEGAPGSGGCGGTGRLVEELTRRVEQLERKLDEKAGVSGSAAATAP